MYMGVCGCARVSAGVGGIALVCMGVRWCAWVCTGVCGYAWICACVWDEFSEFLLKNRVPTSADFNTYPIRIFFSIFQIIIKLKCYIYLNLGIVDHRNTPVLFQR